MSLSDGLQERCNRGAPVVGVRVRAKVRAKVGTTARAKVKFLG